MAAPQQQNRSLKRWAAQGYVFLCMTTLLYSVQHECNALSIRSVANSRTDQFSITCPVRFSSSTRLNLSQDKSEVDDATAEAEKAIAAANALMSETDAMTRDSPLKRSIPPPPSNPPQKRVSNASLSPQGQNQLIAAIFSGSSLGAIAGLVLQAQFDDTAIEPAIVIGIVTIAFGAATYVVAKNPDETNLISKSVRYFLGQPLLTLVEEIKRQITSSIERTTKEIKSIPTKIQQTVEQKVDDTVTSIQNLPSTVQRKIEQQIQQTQNVATQKVQKTVSSIQQIPNQVKDAALDYADEIVTEIKATPNRVKDAALDIADEIVTEIKATPVKVQQTAAAFVQDTIEDISSIPSKIVASVEKTVYSGPGDTLPQPPKLPPPPPLPSKVEAQSLPSFSVPELPKIELPKIEIPSLPKIDLPSGPRSVTPMKRSVPTSVAVKNKTPQVDTAAAIAATRRKAQEQVAAVNKKAQKQQQDQAAAAAKQKAQQQEQTAAAKLRAQQQDQAVAVAAAKLKTQQKEQAAEAAVKAKAQKQREQEQLDQQKLRLQQAKAAAEEREKQLLIQDEAKEERRRRAAEQERQREQDILRKAQEALQRSREAEEKQKRQELERKKQQEEASKKRQQQLAEQQASAQIQKQQRNAGSTSGGSVRIAGVPQNRAPRGVPTIVKWRQRRDGGISGQIYGSSNFADGERIETSVIVTGTIDNGFVVKTDSGSRYFLSNERPPTKSTTPGDSLSPMQSLLSALPGATITLTKAAKEKVSVQGEAASKKKAENVVVKARPTFSLFGSLAPRTDVSSTGAKKVSSQVAPRGVPTLQRWRKNRDGSVTGVIYGSSNFADGEQVTTSPIAVGTIATGELIRTGSGSKYFLG